MNKKIKKLLLGFLSLMLFFNFNLSIHANAAVNTDKVYEKYVNLVADLSAQDFINADNALSNEPNFKKMNENEKDYYVMEFIVNNYKQVYSYLPIGSSHLNPAEQALASAHPFQATQYYISSQVAIDYTVSKFGYNGYQNASDAFRHAFWNSVLTMRIGSTAAKTWTDAHESTSSGIDKQMDLFNNGLGRSICVSKGYENLNASSNVIGLVTKELSDSVYSAISSGQGKIIVNGTLVASYIN